MTQARASSGDTFAVPPGLLSPGAPSLSYGEIQRLVDRAASYDFFTLPGASSAPVAGAGGAVIGFEGEQSLHRFDVESQNGVRASNTLRRTLGRLALRVRFLPWPFVARPDREPPPTPLDRGHSQRFSLQQATFHFDDSGGFESFGTGRTFPMTTGNRPQLVLVAVGNVMRGFGPYAGVEGNYTMCGELSPEHGFLGHVMLRLVDADGHLREAAAPRRASPMALEDPSSDVTFLTYLAQKGDRTKSENAFSFMSDGTPHGVKPRGVNIPVDLKQVRLDHATLVPGEVIGKEIGFGRETRQRGRNSGTALEPFQFEGVSDYAFYDEGGRMTATFSANFLEGRTFGMRLEGAPGIPALRFSYYGIITGGTGFLEGLQGVLYGAAGSVFLLPPAEHVISNLYVARVADPTGRLRAGAS